MAPDALVESLRGSTAADARRLLRGNRGREGVGKQYFESVLSLLGSDPAAAKDLSRHWKLVLEFGDDKGFAYRSKGIHDRLRGAWADSAEAFILAGRHSQDPVFRYSFQTGAIDGLARAGRMEEAVRLGRRLSKKLEELGRPGLAAAIRLNVGNALIWQDRYAEAIRWYERAIPAMASDGLMGDVAKAQIGLSSCHMFAGDLSRCRETAQAAREVFTRLEMPAFADHCAVNLGQAAILSGRADEALDLFLDLRSRLPEPSTEHGRINEFLGDAYFRLNMWQEAIGSYFDALAERRLLPKVNVANCYLGLGESYLALGEAGKASKRLRQAQSIYRSQGNQVWALSATTSLARCALAQGRSKDALDSSSEAVNGLLPTNAKYPLAVALLVQAESELASEKALGAGVRQADRLIRRHGFAGLEWRVHDILARSAPLNKRLPHNRRLLDAVLRGRTLTSSLTSRTSYLQDKRDALRRALQELLDTPSPKRVAEALEFIRKSRSVALLDEIASTVLSDEVRDGLEGLRQELNSLASENGMPGQTRLAPPTGNLANVRRQWLELTRAVQLGSVALPPIHPRTVVMAEVGDGFFAIQNGRACRLPITRSELDVKLRWLQFELLAPLADKSAPANTVFRHLQAIYADTIEPWLDPQSGTCPISPDGVLWKVPWSLCMAASGTEREPVLGLHPSVSSTDVESLALCQGRRVLWLYQAEDLPHTAIEAERFLRYFPDAEVCQTVAEAKASLAHGPIELLHVATHARLNAANPMFSFIQFGDGRLYATEIARTAGQASLVNLSACETGSLSLQNPDEPDGLVRAFLARSARAVVGSGWSLDDEAASLMSGEFYGRLQNGDSVISSLRSARNLCRAWREHPYYWGALTLFGGYLNLRT